MSPTPSTELHDGSTEAKDPVSPAAHGVTAAPAAESEGDLDREALARLHAALDQADAALARGEEHLAPEVLSQAWAVLHKR